jgi:hypothetical protein
LVLSKNESIKKWSALEKLTKKKGKGELTQSQSTMIDKFIDSFN